MSKILGFDTATHACTVALWIDGDIEERFQIAERQHAELILPMVEDLLASASLELTALDALAYGSGPGSFMGVRIAAGIVQGLAFGAKKPVIPVSTLQALAETAYLAYNASAILPAWDARMKAVYWGAYRVEEGIMQPAQDDRLNEPADIIAPQGEWLAVGNAWEVYQNDFPKELTDQLIDVKAEVYPHAGAIVRIAERKLKAHDTQSPGEALPVYLRNKIADTRRC